MKKKSQSLYLKIYLKGHKHPICIAEINDLNYLDNIVKDLNGMTGIFKFGQVAFNKDQLDYIEALYK